MKQQQEAAGSGRKETSLQRPDSYFLCPTSMCMAAMRRDSGWAWCWSVSVKPGWYRRNHLNSMTCSPSATSSSSFSFKIASKFPGRFFEFHLYCIPNITHGKYTQRPHDIHAASLHPKIACELWKEDKRQGIISSTGPFCTKPRSVCVSMSAWVSSDLVLNSEKVSDFVDSSTASSVAWGSWMLSSSFVRWTTAYRRGTLWHKLYRHPEISLKAKQKRPQRQAESAMRHAQERHTSCSHVHLPTTTLRKERGSRSWQKHRQDSSSWYVVSMRIRSHGYSSCGVCA